MMVIGITSIHANIVHCETPQSTPDRLIDPQVSEFACLHASTVLLSLLEWILLQGSKASYVLAPHRVHHPRPTRSSFISFTSITRIFQLPSFSYRFIGSQASRTAGSQCIPARGAEKLHHVPDERLTLRRHKERSPCSFALGESLFFLPRVCRFAAYLNASLGTLALQHTLDIIVRLIVAISSADSICRYSRTFTPLNERLETWEAA